MSTHCKASMTATHNYGLFTHCPDNRPVNMGKRKKLHQSMVAYGYLPAYPIHCRRIAGKLMIVDGQHRFAVAQELGLAVYYVVLDQSVDIPAIQATQLKWSLSDYAGSYAAQGKVAYVELLEFHQQHRIPLSRAVALLSNTIDHTNTIHRFKSGEFVIKSRQLADRVARLYTAIGDLRPSVKTDMFLAALFAACMIRNLDDDRLLRGAKRCPELLIHYGTRDGYLTMLEQVYNYGQQRRFPLQIEAENAMRARNACVAKGQ